MHDNPMTLEEAIVSYQAGYTDGFREAYYHHLPTCSTASAYYWAGYEDGTSLAYLFLDLPPAMLRQAIRKEAEAS